MPTSAGYMVRNAEGTSTCASSIDSDCTFASKIVSRAFILRLQLYRRSLTWSSQLRTCFQAKKQNTVKRKKPEGATTGDKYSFGPASLRRRSHLGWVVFVYLAPNSCIHYITGDMIKLLDKDTAQKGFQEVQYTHHAPARNYSWLYFHPLQEVLQPYGR